jgi:hypothetical protein
MNILLSYQWASTDIVLDHAMMYRRPDNVTAAGIIICVFALWSGLSALLGLSELEGANENMEAFNKVLMGGASVAMLVAAVNVTRGENWARWLYLVVCGALLLYDLTFLRDQLYALVPAGVIRAISLALLFLPNANRYYASAEGRWD